jgi:hypothetical protein
MEYSLQPRGVRQTCDIMQVACGAHIFVFDVTINQPLLRGMYYVPGVLSLRGLLVDAAIITVLHHGSSHGLVLRSYDIELTNVFDTAVADSLLSKGDAVARHLGEVHDEWLLASLRAMNPNHAEDMRGGLLPFKHTFKFEFGLFRSRPMEPALLQYCWQDVAYMPLLYRTLRAHLLAIHPAALALVFALSWRRAASDLRRGANPEHSANVCAGAEGLLLPMAAVGARLEVRPTDAPGPAGLAARARAMARA